jgi:hypothetical protein
MAAMDYLLRLDGSDLELAEAVSDRELEIGDLVGVESAAVYQIRHLLPPDPGTTAWRAQLFRVWDGVPPSPLLGRGDITVLRVPSEADATQGDTTH